jgi:hypothetical protein
MIRPMVGMVVVGLLGCGLCTEVETFYRGSRSGTLVVAEDGPSQSGWHTRPMTGPWDERTPFSGGTVCTSARIAETPGQVIIAWLSPDDFATVEARCAQPDGGPFGPRPEACAPGSGDPQVTKTYTLPTSGSIVHQLELLEP